MKTFKILDCIVQASLILLGITTAFGGRDSQHIPFLPNSGILNFYLLVGGWQLTSVVVHLAQKPGSTDRLRRIYHKLLVATFWVGVLMIPLWLLFPLILLYWSPVMAILYLMACFKETRKMVSSMETSDSKPGPRFF